MAGTLGYGGSLPWPADLSQSNRTFVYDPDGNLMPVGGPRKASWHRLAMQREPGLARFLLDGVVFHEEKDSDPSDPFLRLSGPFQGKAVFRKAVLTGKEEIPPEVSLVRGKRLEGWMSPFYAKRVRTGKDKESPFLTLQRFGEGEPEDWVARDGIVIGRRVENATSPTPSVLAWVRPLQKGETVSWEFFYQPGEVMVHPVLGRLAFLLEPGGVQLHWLGDPAFSEWLGIKADNAVVEADCRRGPPELPLKAGGWNKVALSLDTNRVRVQLNGVLVYERPAGTLGESFGLFHYQDKTGVRVRNVVLKGDWPRKLSEARRANLFAPEP
jgi:hypothetical protein